MKVNQRLLVFDGFSGRSRFFDCRSGYLGLLGLRLEQDGGPEGGNQKHANDNNDGTSIHELVLRRISKSRKMMVAKVPNARNGSGNQPKIVIPAPEQDGPVAVQG
jgi:hypothetical protein